MFERYNEKARRAIFFARYEASQFGSPYIEAEFLLLGLLREDKALSMRFILPHSTAEAIHREIERHQSPREKISTAVDLPLSNESKHVLAHASEEAERLGHPFIGTEHLLLGILREQNCFASQLLQRHGINLAELREGIAERQLSGPGLQAPRTAVGTLGFFQLALKVARLDASIDFYTKLGFTTAGQHGPGTAILSNGNCVLRLEQNLGVDHLLCFLGPDIIPTVSRLQSAGVQFEQPPHTGANGVTTASLRDPDGNMISFLRPPM